MEWLELIVAVPITALVLGIGGNIIGNILASRERQLKLRLRAEARNARFAPRLSQSKELEALRAEIAALRDTTTQYDLTNDHIVQRLEERLSRIETKVAARPIKSLTEDETIQRLNTH
jgi:hypothetical protein